MTRGHVLAWTVLISAALGVLAWGMQLHVPTLHPHRLGWLPIVGLGAGFALAWQRWWCTLRDQLGDADLVVSQMSHRSPRREQAIQSALVLTALSLMIVASARPQWGETTREVRQHGVDLVLVVDYSRSMLAEDVSPSRLRATVDEIDRLLRPLAGNRVGLVVFAGTAFVQSPLTTDLGALRQYLRQLHPDDMPVQGTNIGMALETAHQLLERAHSGDPSRAGHRIVLLLTDGEDHEEGAVEAARRLGEDTIELIAVGIGTEDGGTIQVRNRFGEPVDVLRRADGSAVITRANLDFLEELAATSGGSALRFTLPGEVAAALQRTLLERERTDFGSASRIERAERHIVFLWPALFLLLLASLRERMAMRHRLLTATALLALLSGCDDGAPWMTEHPGLREALAVAATDPDEALTRLRALESRGALRSIAALERGRILERERRWEEARAAYFEAIADPDLAADAHVGIGNTHMASEAWADAVTRYRRALRLNPEHDAARRNLELAHFRRFPPCATLRDNEEGPRPDSLERLEPGEHPEDEQEGWIVCGGPDPLHLVVPALTGDRVTVTLHAERLRDDTGGPAPPSRIPPPHVTLSLLDAEGAVLATDQGELRPGATDNAQEITRSARTEPLDGRRHGEQDVHIRVQIAPPLEYRIRLSVEIEEPCRRRKGPWQSSTSRSTAQTLNAGAWEQRLCADAPDWYRIEARAGEYLFLDVTPVHDDEESSWPKALTLHGPDELLLRPGREGAFHTAGTLQPLESDASLWAELETLEDREGDYQIVLRQFGTCGESDDHLSPNHHPTQRHPLGANDLPARHLRLCEGQPDWFEIVDLPPEDPETDLEPIVVSIHHSDTDEMPRLHAYTQDGTPLRLHVDREVHEGDPDTLPDPLKPWTMVVYIERVPEMTSMVLVLDGHETFYHLDLPDLVEASPEESGEGGDGDDGEDPPPDDGDEDAQARDDGDDDEDGEPAHPEGTEEDEEEGLAESLEEAERDALLRYLESLQGPATNLPLQQAREEALRHRQQAPAQPW